MAAVIQKHSRDLRNLSELFPLDTGQKRVGLAGGWIQNVIVPNFVIPGIFSFRTIADPAVGQAVEVVVTGNRAWKLIQVRSQLVAGVAVADRVGVLEISDPNGNAWFRTEANFIQVASETRVYNFGDYGTWDSSQRAITNHVFVAKPVIVVVAGSTITISARNIQAADQFSGTNIYIEELPLLP